jgi:hypothetical protein
VLTVVLLSPENDFAVIDRGRLLRVTEARLGDLGLSDRGRSIHVEMNEVAFQIADEVLA